MSEFGLDLGLLSELLNPKKNGDSDEDETEVSTNTELNYCSPADIAANTKPIEEKKDTSTKDIKNEENYDEFEEKEPVDPTLEWKKTPTWNISYRQKVTASDMFLQMGMKKPSTTSCENMVLKVHLPGESRPNVDLKVMKDRLVVDSPRFYLDIPLPQPVNPQLGNAQFDTDTDNLIITLFMEREYDFINF